MRARAPWIESLPGGAIFARGAGGEREELPAWADRRARRIRAAGSTTLC